MARRRKKNWINRVSDISIVSLLFNPATMMLAVTVLSVVLWNQYHAQLDLPVHQTITRDVLHVNQAPDWIKSDLPAIAIQESRLSEIQIDERRAVEMVAASFAVQPWIKQVRRVRKTTSGIYVDLEYRRPMALVEIGEDDLVPVDDEGIVLDGRDFNTPESTQEIWRIYMPAPRTNGLATGREWDDIRVLDSIEIANAWQGQQAQAGLFHIVNRTGPTQDRLRLGFYELWTLRGTIIIWGNPPGREVTGEANAAQKIEAIQKFVSEQGPLDAQTIRCFDVRGGIVVPAANQLAAETADFVKLTY